MTNALAQIEDKYEVISPLRGGGMGMLYLVRHRLLDELRVVKVMQARHVRDATLRERFVREARAAIRLRHPHVVQVHDFSLEAEGGLLVLEHIDGVDLGRVVQAGVAPSLPLGLEIARQALRALGYLHRNGFTHRDVSPDNLMLSLDVERRPHVTLIDLGIAKPVGAAGLTLSGAFVGKLRYASPEHFGQTDSAPRVEPRSDLYALGIVLFELWTGRHPFPASSAPELIAAQLRRRPLAWERADTDGRLPEAARALLTRALHKRPDDRWQTADAWRGEVEALQATLGASEQLMSVDARRLLASRSSLDSKDPVRT
ncbi:MAG: serine/threonine-protein kinase [Acidobacteriota bacterium]